jgi:glycosyltransferase involved in cell wall biosynthesis
MGRKMSVAVISSAIGKTPKDIAYSFIFDEVYRLVQNGIKVHVITSKIEKESLSYGIHFYGIEKKIDPQVLNRTITNATWYPPISLLRKPLPFYWENLYATNIIRVAEKNSVDLIHAHFAYPEGFVGTLVKRVIKKPLIVTCHGYDINTVPEVGYGIRLSKKYDALVHMALENADAIICVSSNLRKEILKLGISPEKTFVVFNAVDLKLFRPPRKHELNDIKDTKKQFGLGEDDFLILNARHLRPIYGIEYLIYAAKIVSGQIRNAKFIIAGEGALKEKLNAMIQSMGLQEYVRLIGKIPKTLMPKLMRAASLYVNTSLADGMSPSMLEACACGLPIVSFDVGGANDIIDDGVNGYLVPSKDYKMLASRITYLLQNTDVIKRMGMITRKKAEERFNINTRIDAMISIYQKIITEFPFGG